jgi:Ca2+-transporting ATPase
VAAVPVALIFLATQLPSLQRGLHTTPLTGPQWLAAISLALALPLVIEAGKWIRRRRVPESTLLDVEQAVAPDRALISTP